MQCFSLLFVCALLLFCSPFFAVCFEKMNPLLLQGLPENVRSLLLLDENLPESVAWKDMVLFQDISQDVGVTGIRRATAGGAEKTTYGFSLSLPLLEVCVPARSVRAYICESVSLNRYH